MLARIDALFGEATPSPARARIEKRDAIYQLVQIVPHLTPAQQLGGLRRLRQLVNRSLYNVEVCTSGLQLVSVMLRWLHPDDPAPAPAVLDEIIDLLGFLGGYRATPQELRTLFDLLQAALALDVEQPASGGGSPRSSFALTRPGHATTEQLLRLLIRWCEPSSRDEEAMQAGPMGPQSCFDLDGVGGGLTLPPELAEHLDLLRQNPA